MYLLIFSKNEYILRFANTLLRKRSHAHQDKINFERIIRVINITYAGE